MKHHRFSQRSIKNLGGVHPALVNVLERALMISAVDFGITQGLRTIEEQKENVAKGASQTMNSRHLTGHAVDVLAYPDGKASWDWEHYEKINEAVQTAALEHKVPVIWGGSWTTLKDGCHFELDRRKYP